MRSSIIRTSRAVSFVGSTPIAKLHLRDGARNGKRVQALGGAKNHVVVLPDADLEFAADAVIGAAYGAAGERCMAVSAVVAVGAVGRHARRPIAQEQGEGHEGRTPAMQEGVEMGPLVTCAASRQGAPATSTRASRKGRALVVDGRGSQVPGREDGFFIGTTLFDHVKPDMKIYKEEIFGPVLVVRARRNAR